MFFLNIVWFYANHLEKVDEAVADGGDVLDGWTCPMMGDGIFSPSFGGSVISTICFVLSHFVGAIEY